MSFFIALLLGCIDLHLFEVHSVCCRTQIGGRLRRAIKLQFRKLNSISSKQIRERTHRLTSKHYILFIRTSEQCGCDGRAKVLKSALISAPEEKPDSNSEFNDLTRNLMEPLSLRVHYPIKLRRNRLG
jgi:hypothetical protein